MCERNPLQISPAPAASNGNKNPKGRPLKRHSITFSTQPKSIVSQLIQNMISQNNVVLPIEKRPEENTHNNCISNEELYQTQGHLSPIPKKNEPKMYSCEFSNCDYSTKLSSNLLKHRRTHTGEKPYLCDRCSFRTNFSNSLKVHKRLHTTERPYQCINCDYRCNSVSNLKKHTQTRHKYKSFNVMETTVNTG